MKNFGLIGVAFITVFIFGELTFTPQMLSASDTQNTQKSWWQRQKEKRATSKNQMNIGSPQGVSKNETLQRKDYNANVCGRCLNPIEARKFIQGEINYCKKSCPDDLDIQDPIYPENLFKENISRKRDVAYGEKIDLVELLRKIENRMGLEMYRQCDGLLQQLYSKADMSKDPNVKNNLELQLRQTRKMFHDSKAKNNQKINVLQKEINEKKGTLQEGIDEKKKALQDVAIDEKKFVDTFFDIFGEYDLTRKNCTRDFGLINEQLNKSMTSTQTPQKKGWSRSK